MPQDLLTYVKFQFANMIISISQVSSSKCTELPAQINFLVPTWQLVHIKQVNLCHQFVNMPTSGQHCHHLAIFIIKSMEWGCWLERTCLATARP
eukprot:6484419-Amphidinium_carterae.1